MEQRTAFDFDVAIIGGGPAGLSAALTLSRARRRVVVIDHAKPRNAAARAVHCFLGNEGAAPFEIRRRGKEEASIYGAVFVDAEVVAVRCSGGDGRTAFEVEMVEQKLSVRSVLFATGMIDELPDIPGLTEFYGTSIHHCPYCDGWEHRDQKLAALGNAEKVTKLAAMLLGWSSRVAAFTNGEVIGPAGQRRLEQLGIDYRHGAISQLRGADGVLEQVVFDDGTRVSCDALFFSSDQAQRSRLPELMGCMCDDDGLIVTKGKQCTSVEGVYLAGDADGDVQFSVVAAAEGAVAATAINQALLDQDLAE